MRTLSKCIRSYLVEVLYFLDEPFRSLSSARMIFLNVLMHFSSQKTRTVSYSFFSIILLKVFVTVLLTKGNTYIIRIFEAE